MGSVAADIFSLHSHTYNAVTIRMPEASKYVTPPLYTTLISLEYMLDWHGSSYGDTSCPSDP